MKVVILAGGLGTRLAEETEIKPKPMVEIGGRPILWHIMKIYSAFGFKDFIIALGYKSELIKKYMTDYLPLNNNLTVKLDHGIIRIQGNDQPDWTVQLVDTGINTMTGGRLKRLAPYIGDERFMMTYGDGLSNVNIPSLINFHCSHRRLATLTAVRPPARYGHLVIEESGKVSEFSEKPQTSEGWINGAFFVLEPEVINYIEGDNTQWEKEPLEKLALEGNLMAYKHSSFWQCMDTLRDKYVLEKLWQQELP
ncbi:MAG: glucose-1-phosphate cytidylyltransferase, partial [Syntrophothermus sp.]